MKIKLECENCKHIYTLYDFEYFNHDFYVSCPKCDCVKWREIKREVEKDDTIPK